MSPGATSAGGHQGAALTLALLLLLSAGAWARADEPDMRQMIDALKPTLSRNLVVRRRPAEEAPEAASSAASAAPSAAPEPAPSLSLDIHFETASAQLRPDSGALLGSLVAAMLSPELRDARFVIEGHTDARGNPARNLRLSQERADQVRLVLTSLGVQPARLRAVGKGAAELANPADPFGPENRRVRVVTLP